MAVVIRVHVRADRDAYDRLEAALDVRLARNGGPPEGLLTHLVYPDGDGFTFLDAFRNDAAARAWWPEVEGAIAEVGLDAGPTEVSALWSFARP